MYFISSDLNGPELAIAAPFLSGTPKGEGTKSVPEAVGDRISVE